MDANFELTAQQANDITWNHMRSVVFTGPQTAGQVLRVANNLFSGMEARMKTADITAAIEAFEVQAEAALVVGEEAAKAAERAAALNDPNADATGSPYYADAAYLLVDLFRAAKDQGHALQTVNAFHRLATDDGYRVHKLLISLKRGRLDDVLTALLAY